MSIDHPRDLDAAACNTRFARQVPALYGTRSFPSVTTCRGPLVLTA